MFSISHGHFSNATGPCEEASNCNGVNHTCPANVFLVDVLCRNATGNCDEDEYCSGFSANCPADEMKGNYTVCRYSQLLFTSFVVSMTKIQIQTGIPLVHVTRKRNATVFLPIVPWTMFFQTQQFADLLLVHVISMNTVMDSIFHALLTF
jgi:hypothetical protein